MESEGNGFETEIRKKGFTRLEGASTFLSARIEQKLDQAGIENRYATSAGVFASEAIISQALAKFPGSTRESLTSGQLLQTVGEAGGTAAYYAPGIGGSIEGNGSEWYQKTGVAGMQIARPDLSADAKELHKRTFKNRGGQIDLEQPVDFLAGYCDVVIMSEVPAGKRGLQTELKAEVIAQKEIWGEYRKAGITPEMYFWSYKGFEWSANSWHGFADVNQDIRTAIDMGLLPKSGDLPSWKETREALLRVKLDTQRRRKEENWDEKGYQRTDDVHDSGFDALEYFEATGAAEITVGGSPDDWSKLTFPGETGETEGIKKIMNKVKILGIRTMAKALGAWEKTKLIEGLLTDKPAPKWLVDTIWKLLPDKIKQDERVGEIRRKLDSGEIIPGNMSLLLSRFAEMGRAKVPVMDFFTSNARSQEITRGVLSEIRGQGLTTILVTPGVGDVVDDTRSRIGQIMEAMTPGKVMCVSGNSESPYSLNGETANIATTHSLIKEAGVMDHIRAVQAAWHLGIVTQGESEERIGGGKAVAAVAGRVVPVGMAPVGSEVSGSARREAFSYDLAAIENIASKVKSGAESKQMGTWLERFNKVFDKKQQAMYLKIKPIGERLRYLVEAWCFLMDEPLPLRASPLEYVEVVEKYELGSARIRD